MKGMKPPSEGMGIPPMMKQMIEKMCGGGEVSPAAMCQGMMASTGMTAETDVCASPEAREVFEEWARGVEDQVLAALKARGPLDLAALAGALEISPGSALYFLGKLAREGKATIGSIRAAGGPDAAD